MMPKQSPAVLPFGALAALEWTDTPMWVFDLDGKCMYWANSAGLDFWHANSLGEFLARDFSALSLSTITRNQMQMDEHMAGRCGRDQWTVYPLGQPTTLNAHTIGIALPDGRRAILYEASLMPTELNPSVLRGVEAMQQTPVIICLHRMSDGCAVMRNPPAIQSFGNIQEEGHGDEFSAMFADPSQAAKALLQLRDHQIYIAEAELLTQAGPHWFSIDMRSVLDPVTGEPMIQVSAHSVNERRLVETALRESEALFRNIFDNNLDASLLIAGNGNILAANLEAQRLFGYSEAELRSLDIQEVVGNSDPDLAVTLAQSDQEKEFRGEFILAGRLGKRFPGEISCAVFKGANNGKMRSMVIRDITKRRLSEQQLRIAATAFEAQEGLAVTDADRVILQVNRAFTEITGYDAKEVVGKKISLLKSGRHDADFYAEMWRALREKGTWQGEIWNRRKNGDVYPQWLTITAVHDANGAVSQYVSALTDITLRKAAENEIKQLAFYDPLTQLPNRRLLLNRLQQSLVTSTRTKHFGSLLFVDLDNFKTLNDTLGHDVGDHLLLQVAERLSACVRECDTVARLGGDEFVLMLEALSDTPLEAAAHTETVGQKILAVLNQPYTLEYHPYYCTASIGATLFSGQVDSVDELMKRADMAMYKAKADGRNAFRFFDPKMQVAITARSVLEMELRRGLQDRQFCLYYQSQVDEHGHVIGAEALVRWLHPSIGLMTPNHFISLAEETRLILPLGQWVLETACEQLSLWAEHPKTANLVVAVNVSAIQLRQIDFVDCVLAALKQSGANPYRLKLELTESLLLDNVEDTISKMTALKSFGVNFSLDDFGTGYSSLAYLKRLPLDQVKIDKSFVRGLPTDSNDVVIARTIVALAHSLGFSVIAEGVETEAQKTCLASEGCKAYQGYLFSKPLPINEFEAQLK